MEYESTTKNVLNTSEEEAPKKSQNPEEPKVRNNPNTEVKPTGTSSPKEKPPAGTPENKPPQKSKASKANTKQNYTAEKNSRLTGDFRRCFGTFRWSYFRRRHLLFWPDYRNDGYHGGGHYYY